MDERNDRVTVSELELKKKIIVAMAVKRDPKEAT